MEIKYKIWIEENGKVIFGKGRYDILKSMERQRSLNAAAKELGMSYRAAWGRLKASQERMGGKLVENDSNMRSMQPTSVAQIIIERFEKLEQDVEKLLQTTDREFKKLMLDDQK
jgi:molybdate transport system regulatory protein